MHGERRTKRTEIAASHRLACRLQTLVNKCGMRKRERIKIVLSAGEAPEARTSRKGRGSIGIFFGEVRQGLELTLSRRRLLHTSVRESSIDRSRRLTVVSPHHRRLPIPIRDRRRRRQTLSSSPHFQPRPQPLLLHMTRPLPSSKSLCGSSSMTEEQLVRYPIRGFRWRDSRPLRRIV